MVQGNDILVYFCYSTLFKLYKAQLEDEGYPEFQPFRVSQCYTINIAYLFPLCLKNKNM